MKITFCGAASGVTGSCHMISTDQHKILFDCGQFQGGAEEEARNREPFPFNPAEIECVVLSHAHIDHCGRLPLLVKQGFKGEIYCTDATADLLDVMLKDSAHIHEQEAEWKNRKAERAGHALVEPLYTADDALDTLKLVRPVLYDTLFALNDQMKIVFNDAGHILGSAIIELWVEENGKSKKMVFSGKNQEIISGAKIMAASDVYMFSGTTTKTTVDNVWGLNSEGSRFNYGNYEVDPFRGYFRLRTSVASAPESLVIVGAGTDGIEMIPATPADGMVSVYNLSGIKVAEVQMTGGRVDLGNLPRGIYVINGQKFIK